MGEAVEREVGDALLHQDAKVVSEIRSGYAKPVEACHHKDIADDKRISYI